MIRALELFSCSGGMAAGFQAAGVTFSFAFDKDPDAIESYERNHGHRPIGMDVRDLVRLVRGGWSPGTLDLIVADPPCTPWSRAGKRLGVEDERDMLHETAELLALLRPRAFLIGNVPGLDDSTQWHHVQDAIGGLSRHGYCVADYAQLDAAAYGVPQHRVRPFWYGHREGPCVRWPEPTHGKGGEQSSLPGVPGLTPYVTCRQALQHLPLEDLGRPVRLRWKDGFKGPNHRPSEPGEPAATITRNTHSDGCLIMAGRREGVVTFNPKHPPSTPEGLADTIGAKDRCQTTTLLASDTRAWPWDRPATTVCGTDRLVPPGHHEATMTSKVGRVGAGEARVKEWPWEDRPSTTVCAGIDKIAPRDEHAGQYGPNAIVLSERAAAILQGFPDGWVFAGKTKRSRWSQIGQAMPPSLAEAVARAILRQMEATAIGGRVA